jgi:RND superfamily putative drug exporter
MIFLESSSLDFEEDEVEIGEHVHDSRDLLADTDGFFDFVAEFEESIPVPAGFIANTLPTEAEIEEAEILLTGTFANIVDTLEITEESFANSELIAAIVITVILFLVFRTPLGVFIPMIATLSALLPAYLATALIAQTGFISVNDFLPAVIAMIGIAVAVDYNLFMLVRYREEYRKRRASLEAEGLWNRETRHQTQVESSKKMNATAGTAIMYSGLTVMIGFAALFISPDGFSKAMAVGVSLVVLISVIAARTLTPAILAVTGRFLDWPNVTSRANQDVESIKNEETELKGFWVNWSRTVMRFPWVFLLMGILIMTPFIVFSTQTELSFSLTKSVPAGTESRTGFEIIQEEFDLGEINPFSIIIDAGEENGVFDQKLFDAVNDLAAATLAFSGTYGDNGIEFASVTTLMSLQNSTDGTQIYADVADIEAFFASPDAFFIGDPSNFSQLVNPDFYIPNFEKILFLQHAQTYINWDVANDTLVVEVTSNLDPGSGEAWELFRVLEDLVDEYLQPLIDDGTITYAQATGLTGLFVQSSEDLYRDVPLMLTVAVVLIFLALLILFRSVILPIKAILTIGGSILFGLGILVLVFQEGYFQLIELFGVTLWEAEVSGLTYFLPVFLFTTILGLGMDYSIFIISRIKEEYEKSGNMDDAVGLGLSKTAGVVTSAATIMIFTFMVFALSPMLTLKMMGLAMSVAIFADATIARTVLLPAAMKLAGKYNWWLPGWLKKILPEIKLEH